MYVYVVHVEGVKSEGPVGYVTGSLLSLSLRSVTMTVTWTDSLWSLPQITSSSSWHGHPNNSALRINKRLPEGKSIKQPDIYKWRSDISCDNRVVTFLFRSVIRCARADGKARVTRGHSSSPVTFTFTRPPAGFSFLPNFWTFLLGSLNLFWSWADVPSNVDRRYCIYTFMIFINSFNTNIFLLTPLKFWGAESRGILVKLYRCWHSPHGQ